MDKLYSWEISHHLPNHWTPYDASQSNGGQIALESFVLTHTPAQAQTQDTSSMAPGQYQDYQKLQKLRDSQLSSDNNNNNTNINKNDTLTLSIITTTKRVLSVFDNNPDNFFVWYKKENVDQLPSRQVNGFNSSAEPLWALSSKLVFRFLGIRLIIRGSMWDVFIVYKGLGHVLFPIPLGWIRLNPCWLGPTHQNLTESSAHNFSLIEGTLIIGGQKYDWTEEFAWTACICWDCYTNRVFVILNKISDTC